jgi:hypothetical protein
LVLLTYKSLSEFGRADRISSNRVEQKEERRVKLEQRMAASKQTELVRLTVDFPFRLNSRADESNRSN